MLKGSNEEILRLDLTLEQAAEIMANEAVTIVTSKDGRFDFVVISKQLYDTLVRGEEPIQMATKLSYQDLMITVEAAIPSLMEHIGEINKRQLDPSLPSSDFDALEEEKQHLKRLQAKLEEGLRMGVEVVNEY